MMINTLQIKNEDISFIVQGPVTEQTAKVLEGIRNIFPSSVIILSTWQGTEVSGLNYDKVLFNDDPGAVLMEFDKSGKKIHNNVNRQILSVQNALKEVGTKYAMKTRTDIFLKDNLFLEYFGRFDSFRDTQNTIFKQRILNYYLFASRCTIVNDKKIPVLFHPSDWMFFGLSEDLKTLFDLPLQPEPESTLYWKQHKKPKDQYDSWGSAVFRHPPEQYLFYSCVKKHFPQIKFDNYMDITREKEELSRKLMVNNFLILDFRQWHIQMPKYGKYIGVLSSQLYSYNYWLKEYKKYCNPQQQLPLDFGWMSFDVGKFISRHCNNICHAFVFKFFKGLYKKNLYRKYAYNPEKLAQKLNFLEGGGPKYIYIEDKPGVPAGQGRNTSK